MSEQCPNTPNPETDSIEKKLQDLKLKIQHQFEKDPLTRSPLYPHHTLQIKQLEQKIRCKIEKIQDQTKAQKNLKDQIQNLKIKKLESFRRDSQAVHETLLINQKISKTLKEVIRCIDKTTEIRYIHSRLSLLPITQYDPISHPSQTEITNYCGVCENLIQIGSPVRISKCNHMYHPFCLQQILIFGKCVICNNNLAGPSISFPPNPSTVTMGQVIRIQQNISKLLSQRQEIMNIREEENLFQYSNFQSQQQEQKKEYEQQNSMVSEFPFEFFVPMNSFLRIVTEVHQNTEENIEINVFSPNDSNSQLG